MTARPAPAPRGDPQAGEAGPPPDLSVVVVTHESSACIAPCLESLLRDAGGLRLEVQVVDSGSRDGTADLVRRLFPGQVELTAVPDNIGFSPSNNLALPRCRGRYVALLNPDTVVPAGTFPALLAHLDAHPAAGAAGPTLRLLDGRIQPECARNLPRVGNLFSWLLLLDKLEWGVRFRHRPAPDGHHPPRGTLLDRFTLLSWSRSRTCEVESICGACMVIRREVVERVGPLEETQPMYLEDIDYCRRIRDAGWAIHYVAEASLQHRWQHSTSARRRDGDFYALGCHAIWLYLRKHEGRAAAAAYGAMAATAAPLRILTALLGLGLSLVLRARGVAAFWRRHLQMAWGLGRWAWRWPRAAPDLGIGPSGGRPASGGPRSSERTRGR